MTTGTDTETTVRNPVDDTRVAAPTAARGDVTIDGSPQAGATLTANTAAVADPVNGLSAPGYRYQWERADDAAGANAEQIAGATQVAYTPTAADEGKFLRVTVAFTDDDGYAETKTSAWTAAVAALPEQQPEETNTLSGRLEVDEDRDGRVDRVFLDTDGNGTFDRIEIYRRNDDKEIIRTDFDDDADGRTDRAHFDPDADGTVDWSEFYDDGVLVRIVYDADGDGTPEWLVWDVNGHADMYVWDLDDRADTYMEDPESTAPPAADVVRPGDVAATGDVTVDGPPQVGETLTADTSAITDPVNGLSAPGYRYQWERADDAGGTNAEQIAGATQAAYAPTAADEGKFLRVTVAFTDDDGYAETKTSEWTAAVAAAPTPAVGDVTIDDPPQTGLAPAQPEDAAPPPVGPPPVEAPSPDVVRPADVAATGDVTIDGPPQVGETLTADTSAITDPVNGLSAPGYRYQWERADDAAGTNAEQIAGATQVAYTPAAVDEGKFLRVTVAFTDDDGYAETKTSELTAAVAPMPAVGDVTIDDPPQTGLAPEQTEDAAPPPVGPPPIEAPPPVEVSTPEQKPGETGTRPGLLEVDEDRDGHTDKVFFDTDGNGAFDHVEIYQRNDDKEIILTRFDDDADGHVDRDHFDPNADGAADRIEIHARDSAGRIIRTEFDDDADNTLDRTESYVRDVNGVVIQTDFDDDANGTTDRAAFDDEGDGAVDRTESYVRNAAGDVIQTDYDDDVDGTTDRAAFDDDGDGAVDRIESYTYDAHGRLTKKVMAVDGEPAEEPEIESVSLGRSAAGASGARGVAGKETGAAGEAGARTPFESMLEDLGEGAVIRSETYTRNAAGDVVRTDFDEGDDGIVERSSVDDDGDGVIDEHHYDHDANGEPDWVGRDSDNDGMLDRLEFHGQWGVAGNLVVHTITLLGDGPAYTVTFHDGNGAQLASGWSDTGPGALDGFTYSASLDVVSELQTAASAGSAAALLPVDATLLAGVLHIDLAGAGAGSTDLTLSTGALAVLADGDSGYQLRIDGDGDDTLRFDMDDFTRGDDVAVDGESYEQYAGATGSFIVDPDVTLVDV